MTNGPIRTKHVDGQQLSQVTMQEATLSKQQSAQSDVKTKLRSQLQQSQGHAAQLESQLAAATEAASRSQTAQSAQLQQLSEQHAGVLRQLRADHEAQLEAATQHHKVMNMSQAYYCVRRVCMFVHVHYSRSALRTHDPSVWLHECSRQKTSHVSLLRTLQMSAIRQFATPLLCSQLCL